VWQLTFWGTSLQVLLVEYSDRPTTAIVGLT